jgi:mannose-1-phosphate guanylyltransferase/mannose-6-phosphate isomerase
MALVLLSCFWNDIGTFDALYEIMDKDEDDNVLMGDVVASGCSRSMFLGKKRLVVGVGLKDIFVVDTDDVLLVAQKGQTTELAALANKLRQEGRPEIARKTNKDYTPWGNCAVLEEGANYKVCKATIAPGAFTQENTRRERGESIVAVTKGSAVIFIDGAPRKIDAGRSVAIAGGAKYKIGNPGDKPAEAIIVDNDNAAGK